MLGRKACRYYSSAQDFVVMNAKVVVAMRVFSSPKYKIQTGGVVSYPSFVSRRREFIFRQNAIESLFS